MNDDIVASPTSQILFGSLSVSAPPPPPTTVELSMLSGPPDMLYSVYTCDGTKDKVNMLAWQKGFSRNILLEERMLSVVIASER